MTTDALRIALRAFTTRKPFIPFIIELFSGSQFRVNHPEAVTFYGKLLYHVAPDKTRRLLQSDSVCQVIDIPKSPAT